MLNSKRLEQSIFDIRDMLSDKGDLDEDTILNIATILASIKENCRMHGVVCKECPFYVSERMGCCFAPAIHNNSGAPEMWVFKDNDK